MRWCLLILVLVVDLALEVALVLLVDPELVVFHQDLQCLVVPVLVLVLVLELWNIVLLISS